MPKNTNNLNSFIVLIIASMFLFGSATASIIFNPIYAHHIVSEIPVQRPTGLSIDNGLLYVSNMGTSAVSVINVTTDKIVKVINSSSKTGIIDVVTTPNKIYLAPFESGTIEVYDKASQNLTNTIQLPSAKYSTPTPLADRVLTKAEFVRGVWALAYNPTNKVLYAAYADAQEILAIDTSTDKIIASIPVANHPVALQVDPLTNTLLVASLAGNKVTFISTETNQVTDEIETGIGPWHIALDEIYHKAYIANRGSYYVTVVDIIGHQIIGKIPISSPALSIAVDEKDHAVYVSHGQNGIIDKINGQNNEIVTSIDLGSVIPQDIAVDSQTHKVYVSTKSYDKIFVLGPEAVSYSIPIVSLDQPFSILGNIQVHGQDIKPSSLLSISNNTLILDISAPDGGNVGIDIPRNILDSKSGQNDVPFKVLMDGKQSQYSENRENINIPIGNDTISSRSLDINIPGGTNTISIIGTQSISNR